MVKKFVQFILVLVLCAGLAFGYSFWRDEQTSIFINKQMKIYYNLFDQGYFKSIYDRLTSARFREENSAEEFKAYLHDKHMRLGQHQTTNSNDWVLTYRLGQNEKFTSMHKTSYRRGKSVDQVLWVREGRYWKIERLQINPY